MSVGNILVQIQKSVTVTVNFQNVNADSKINWKINSATAQEFAKIGGQLVVPRGALQATFTIASIAFPGSGSRTYSLSLSDEAGKIPSATSSLVLADGTGPISVSLSATTTCASLEGLTKCWGSNSSGQYGTGDTTSVNYPNSGVNLTGISGAVVQVSTAGGTSCAIVSGALACWGSNSTGQLGDGTTTNRLKPAVVPGLTGGVTAVSVGTSHVCAVQNSSLLCWGLNSSGQLGDGTTTNRLSPVTVPGLATGVTSVSTSVSSTCAIQNEALKCWGANSSGQLGDGTLTTRLSPVAISPLSSKVTAVSMGTSHTCAIASGQVRCWGANGNGQLGDGTTTMRLSPPSTVLSLTGIATQILAGLKHSCVLVEDAIYCWGSNSDGELGNEFITSSLTPFFVETLDRGVIKIAGGAQAAHTCAVVFANSKLGISCWGRGSSGQIGNRQSAQVLVPVGAFTLQ